MDDRRQRDAAARRGFEFLNGRLSKRLVAHAAHVTARIVDQKNQQQQIDSALGVDGTVLLFFSFLVLPYLLTDRSVFHFHSTFLFGAIVYTCSRSS